MGYAKADPDIRTVQELLGHSDVSDHDDLQHMSLTGPVLL